MTRRSLAVDITVIDAEHWRAALGIPSDPHDDTLQHYESGFACGYRAGRLAAHADIEADWARMAKRIVALGTSPSHPELQRRCQWSAAPCRQACRRCSQCMYSLAYWRRGGRDYLGLDGEQQLVRGEHHLGLDGEHHVGRDGEHHVDLGLVAR